MAHITRHLRFIGMKNLGERSLSRMQLRVTFHKIYSRSYSVYTPSVSTSSSRSSIYSYLDQKHIKYFQEILGKTRVLTGDENDLSGYNTDWLKSIQGNSKLVLKPKTTEEVSKILEFCDDYNLAVCPQGGNTGISGGSVPLFDEIILSTSLMNQIISFNEISGALECQSGCILHNLKEHLSPFGFEMPLDLGSKESCQIGGNVSTNAGGLRVIKFGNLHGSILGVEAVLADGTVLDCMSTMKKDNTGYDLKHLFIGSEGTLGIITKVAIQCRMKSNSVNLAFLGLESYPKVLETFKKAKKELGEILSACEYMDSETIRCAEQNLGIKSPIKPHPYYMMIETSGSNSLHDEQKLTHFLEDAMSSQTVEDGTIASDLTQMKGMWHLRDRFAESLLKDGHLHIFDFSVPIESFEDLVLETRKFIGHEVKRVTGFGHLGDGNIHLNVTLTKRDDNVKEKLEPFLYSWVSSRKGSISAEHGLGSIKQNSIHFSKSQESIVMMKRLKDLFDPKKILNPYKVLPTTIN